MVPGGSSPAFGKRCPGTKQRHFGVESGPLGELSVGTGVVHNLGELLGQNLGQLVNGNIEAGGQLAHGVASQNLLQLLSRDRQV